MLLACVLLVALGAFAACREESDSLEAVRRLQAKGQFAATLEPLRELLAENPSDPEPNYLYGRALLATQQITSATWPLRQAMEDPDWLLPAGVELAHAGLVSADFNEVVRVTTKMLESHPDDPTALLYRAQANAHWRKDPEAALADARRLLEIAPETLDVFEPLILALLELGRVEEANQALAEAGSRLEEVGASEGQKAWHCSTTAVFAMDAGEVDRARELWAGCLERFPANPTVVTNAVEFHDSQREIEQSIGILRRALEVMPQHRNFRLGLAARLRVSGEIEEAEALLRKATEAADPRLATGALADLARFLHETGEYDRAAEALGQAVAKVRESGEDPGPSLLFGYADALVVAKQLDRAAEVAEEISVPAQRRLILGRIWQERGDSARALAEFDEALRLWPNNAAGRYYAAVAAEALGDFDRALEEYRYSIRIDFGATDARTRAGRLLIAEGQLQKAYQVLFLEVAKKRLEPEGELLSMYLMGRVANPKQLQNALATLASMGSPLLPRALIRGADGVLESAGAPAALNLLATAPGMDYSQPRNAPVLRKLVQLAHLAGRPEVASQAVAGILGSEVAAFHEIEGLHRELSGDDPARARAAYERALELDGNSAAALASLARLDLATNPEAALALFDRAAAADPSDVDSRLGAARALRALGREGEAIQRLDALLRAHPFSVDAAAEEVALDLGSGRVTSKTLERAQRVARFGGDPVSLELLARVQMELGQAERAEETLARLEQLKELLSTQSPADPPVP